MTITKTNIWPLLGLEDRIDIVDIGANPIDGDARYQSLLDAGHARLIAFEPQQAGFEQLLAKKEPHTTILPYAIGDGTEQPFYRCFAPGMSSTLKPDIQWLHFMLGFEQWSEVVETTTVKTKRLDDLAEVSNSDFLKIDIQGGELNVFKNGMTRISDAVLLQTEVSFNPLYENEPLFADIDAQLRKMGFVFHTFDDINHRCFSPVILNQNPFLGNRQVFQADVVYVRDYRHFERLNSVKLRKLAWLLHELYFSFDLVQIVLFVHDKLYGTSLRQPYIERTGITLA